MERADKQAPYLIFVLALSVFALAALALEVLLPLDPDTLVILEYADTAICALFFSDFLLTLWRSENRLRYLLARRGSKLSPGVRAPVWAEPAIHCRVTYTIGCRSLRAP